MRQLRSYLLCSICFLGLGLPKGAAASAPGSGVAARPHYATLPLGFEPNQGQVAGTTEFLARGRGYTLLLSGKGAVLRLRRSPLPKRNNRAGDSFLGSRFMPDFGNSDSGTIFRLRLVGAADRPTARAQEPFPGKVNYFLGNDPGRWRTNIPTFGKVRYEKVYPGIDLVYYGNQGGQLEYDFVVAPGADSRQIALLIDTEQQVGSKLKEVSGGQFKIDSNGDLVVPLDGGSDVRFHKPVVYQDEELGVRSHESAPKHEGWNSANRQSTIGNRQFIDARYVLTASNQVRFTLGPYDHTKPLVIDPVLTYSTYLGGTGSDVGYGIAVDSAGEIYVTGTTVSANFPIQSGEQTTYAGDGDVFLTKFNAAGTGLIFSTYIGGSGADTANAIQIDSSGNIYLAGTTYSTNFPTTPGTAQTTYGGNGDAFITKVKPDGSALVYSTYLGGSQADYGAALALDSAGDVFLTGSTQSSDFPIHTPLLPLQPGLNGTSTPDVFVAEINPAGSALLYSTYLGGSSSDYGTAIALDSSGNVYVAGYTFSTDYPTSNALQSSLQGGSDIFVTEFKPGSTALLFSTFLGGSSIDRAFGMALDSVGSIYLVGDTQSTNFPTTPNAYQSTNNGSGDAFVAKINPTSSPTQPIYSTLLGGSGTDQATALALDSAGEVYLTGFTQSSDFPSIDPLQSVVGISGAGNCSTSQQTILCSDAFVAKLGPSGALLYSTFLGGSNADVGQAIAVDSSGTAHVTGSSASPNFPVTPGGFQWAYGGSTTTSNAFVAKIGSTDGPALIMNPQQVNFGNQPLNIKSDPITVTLGNEGSAPLSISSINAGGGVEQTNTCGTQLPAGGSTCTLQVTFTPSTVGSQTNQITIDDNSAGSPHYIAVTGTGVLSGGTLSLTPASLTFPAQAVTTTSAPQAVVLVNTGNVAVTVTKIAITGDFSETNTCGGLPTTPAVLNVGQACTIAVTFTPVGSGSRSGSLTVTSNAGNTATAVTLSGIGTPQFSLSANTRSSIIVVGTTSTTFSVAAAAPSSFTGNITLSCSSGATCAFNPTSISAGGTSTLTVSSLSATTANPLNFTVTGTSGSQTSTLALVIFLADYTLSAAPLGTSVKAGSNATYTVTVTPLNGFNQVVFLSCGGIPAYTTCTFAPPGLALTGSGNLTSTLTVTTTAQTGLYPKLPTAPPARFLPLPGMVMMLLLAMTAGLTALSPRLRRRFRLIALGGAIALAALGLACDTYVNPINITPVVNGTPSGNYRIPISGALGTNSAVTRSTTVNLTVSP